MKSFAFLATLCLTIGAAFAAPSESKDSSHDSQSPRSINPSTVHTAQAHKDLASLLSCKAVIIKPDDARYPNATERYQDYALPHVQLVVQPGTEEDIPIIVQYANNHSIDFFLVNRAHSLTSTVSAFNGIQIHAKSLRGIEINDKRETVRLQAGAYTWEVIQYLWERGYETATPSAQCVGMIGPALGGGHGLLQGKYGLISDNILSMNVVLANGKSVTVSKSSHPKLWWAMRGAGHNFGIVTSIEMKIYPAKVKSYYYRNYVFKGKVLEPLFQEVNKLHANGTLTSRMIGSFGVYAANPEISKTEAIISWLFLYGGSKEEAAPLLKPFEAIESVVMQQGDVPFPKVADVAFSGVDSPLCAPNQTHIVGTAGLQVYNVTTQRAIYELFNENLVKHPELIDTKIVHEGYSVEGVTKHDHAASSFPLRDDYLLMYFDSSPPHGSTTEVVAASKKWARDTVNLFNAGQRSGRRPTTYVNYAAGHESLESVYGYEHWRLERLRTVKSEYDPQNRFAFYNPFVTTGDQK